VTVTAHNMRYERKCDWAVTVTWHHACSKGVMRESWHHACSKGVMRESGFAPGITRMENNEWLMRIGRPQRSQPHPGGPVTSASHGLAKSVSWRSTGYRSHHVIITYSPLTITLFLWLDC